MAESGLTPLSEEEVVNLRADRGRKALWSVVVSYLGRGISIAISLISVPLTLGYLDKERYGLWLTISSIVAYLNVSDLGIGMSLRNRIAEARGAGEAEKIGKLLSTGFLLMVIVGWFVATSGVLISWFAPIGEWLSLSSVAVERELRGTLTVTALTFAYLLPVSAIINAQTGYQEAYLSGLWGFAGGILSLLALLGVVYFKGDMVCLSLATFFVAQLPNLANIWNFFKKHPEARISLPKVDLSLLPSLFGIGWQFFALQIYTVVLWQSDNLVIATQLTPEAVVPYSVAYRLMWIPLSLLSSVPASLWPAYAEAKTRGDWEWIRLTYERTTLVSLLISGLAATVVFVWGQEFIWIWAGPKARGTESMMAALCLYLIIAIWTNCNAMIINAVGRPIEQVFSGFLDACLNLILSLYLVKLWGVAGVAWGTTLACLLVSCWYLATSVCRMTENRVIPPWRHGLLMLLPTVVLSLFTGKALHALMPLSWHNLVRLGLGSTLMAVCYVGSVYLFAPPQWRLIFREYGAALMDRIRKRSAI